MTTCTWDREGKCIAGGIGDGSIQVLCPVYVILGEVMLGCKILSFWCDGDCVLIE